MIEGNLYIAGPFDTQDVKRIESCFRKMLGQPVTLHVKRDDKLIGGFLATLDGKVYDASMRTRMKDMQRYMLDKE